MQQGGDVMYRVDFFSELTVQRDPSQTDEMLRAEVQRIMDELLVLEAAGCKIADTALSLDLVNDRVEVELLSWGEGFDEAAMNANSCLRAAIHAAGGSTPDWHWNIVVRNAAEHHDLADA
jgi:hypothetical protein